MRLTAAPSTHPHDTPPPHQLPQVGSSMRLTAAPSTHPHDTPHHPTNRPLRGSQHPPPRRGYWRSLGGKLTELHSSSQHVHKQLANVYVGRGRFTYIRSGQKARMVGMAYASRRAKWNRPPNQYSRTKNTRSPWEDGPPPRRPRGSYPNQNGPRARRLSY